MRESVAWILARFTSRGDEEETSLSKRGVAAREILLVNNARMLGARFVVACDMTVRLKTAKTVSPFLYLEHLYQITDH